VLGARNSGSGECPRCGIVRVSRLVSFCVGRASIDGFCLRGIAFGYDIVQLRLPENNLERLVRVGVAHPSKSVGACRVDVVLGP
jgi:hypothetical protein